ncbi:MAG: stage V sporulation protein AB [Lachnospiraceae bacterium]|nr:hypothetical protein [Lachnospira sp.]MBR6697877.1 stage V sporulation protein AB [Lachnospiraceae bacterium]
MIKNVVLIIAGFSGGAMIAAAIFAIIVSVRVINRAAYITKTQKFIRAYEECAIWGVIFANIVFIFDVSLPLNAVAVGAVAFFMGTFTGVFLASLAETLKVMPIGLRRSKLTMGLGIVILILALGKMCGGFIGLNN